MMDALHSTSALQRKKQRLTIGEIATTNKTTTDHTIWAQYTEFEFLRAFGAKV